MLNKYARNVTYSLRTVSIYKTKVSFKLLEFKGNKNLVTIIFMQDVEGQNFLSIEVHKSL